MRGECVASRPESFVLSFVKVELGRGRARGWGNPGCPETTRPTRPTRTRHALVLKHSADAMMVRSLRSGGKTGNVGSGNVATLLTETMS